MFSVREAPWLEFRAGTSAKRQNWVFEHTNFTQMSGLNRFFANYISHAEVGTGVEVTF